MTADEQRAIWRERTRRWRAANPERNKEVAKAAMAKYTAPRRAEAQVRREQRAAVRAEKSVAQKAGRVLRAELRLIRAAGAKEREREYARARHATHREEDAAAQSAWREANPEKYRTIKREAKRRYCARYPEKSRAARRRNAKRHPEKNRDYRRRWRLADPARTSMYDRTKTLKKYGLTPEQYDAMNEAQGGLCAICHAPETRTTIDKVSQERVVSCLAVDHDHDTGANRDLLCLRCNNLLGLLESEPEIVATMSAYLAHHALTADT